MKEKFTQAVAWLKKNWKWVLLPIGVLVWLAGRSSKQTTQVVSSSLTQHENYKARIDAQVKAKMDAAAEEREQALELTRRKNDEALRQIQMQAQAKAAELQANPENVNDFLKGVGAGVRGLPKKS